MYSTDYLLELPQLSMSQVIAAIQTHDRSPRSCGIQARGLHEYARIQGLNINNFGQVLGHLALRFHTSPGESNLKEERFTFGPDKAQGFLFIHEVNDSVLFRGEWVTRPYLSYTHGIRPAESLAVVRG